MIERGYKEDKLGGGGELIMPLSGKILQPIWHGWKIRDNVRKLISGIFLFDANGFVIGRKDSGELLGRRCFAQPFDANQKNTEKREIDPRAFDMEFQRKQSQNAHDRMVEEGFLKGGKK